MSTRTRTLGRGTKGLPLQTTVAFAGQMTGVGGRSLPEEEDGVLTDSDESDHGVFF